MATEGLPVLLACRVLEVSESGYYARRSRAPSPRSIRHAWLTDVIRQVHAVSRGIYGIRRVHAELTLGRSITVGHQAVELLMRRAQIQGISGRPKFRRVVGVATAEDRVARQFHPDQADELWVTDVTEHPTREGKVYCAVVLDAWSRRVIGWSIDGRPTTALVTNALGMAIDQRRLTEAPLFTATRARSSPRGRSPGEPSTPVCSPQWVRSGIVSTTRSWSRSGAGCRSSCWTENGGALASSWRTRSSTTSRSSTIANAATRR